MFAIVLLVRVLFVVTFPLNDRGGDSSNYAAMMLDGSSSLVHAGGYPFFAGLPFRTAPLRHLFADHPGARAVTILVLQHGLDLLTLLFLFRVTSDVFGALAGVLALLAAGLDLQALGATSATYPEWLQANCLILYLGLTYYAYADARRSTKALLYAAATLAFTVCVLVKFNAAVLGFVLPLALVADRIAPTRKLAILAVCGVCGAAIGGSYLVLHHQPRTGTYALTHDRAWVLLTRIQSAFGNRLDAAAGPATRRWLALSAVLPRSYEVAGPGMFASVDAVPAEIRAPYRSRFAYLLSAGPVEVARVLGSTRLPDGFSVGLSPIPIGYYIGLEESDALGTRVAVEAVRGDPGRFADVVARDFLTAMRAWPHDSPYPATERSLAAFGAVPEETLPFGFVRLRQRPDYSNVPFSYSRPVVWWPGVRFFGALEDAGPGRYLPRVVLALAALIALVRMALSRRIDCAPAIAILLAAIVVFVVLVSTITLSFRWKEARLVAPLLWVLTGWVAAQVVAAVGRAAGRAGAA